MNCRPLWSLLLLWASALAQPAWAQVPPQPTGLLAEHRSGQTFLTFSEANDPAVDHFRVYRHDQPIDAQNLTQATLLQELWPGSSEFLADRYYKSTTATWQPRYHERFVIVNNGPELAAGTGLLVWTLAEADFAGGSAGNGYYAVTSVDGLGIENLQDFGPGNSVGPVAEQINTPRPVRSKVIVNNKVLIFTQYLDLRRFNPTFIAPNAYNEFYGLDPQDPSVANAIQYAYTYAVVPPDDLACGGGPAGTHPIVIELHGFSGLLARPLTFGPDPDWCDAFRIYPIDPGNSWWFGCARDHDYRVSLDVPAGDVIENFTEQRVIRMVEDLRREGQFQAQIDEQRLFVDGHSMGGSGALALALRYPNYFTGAHASQPMTNYLTSGDGGGTSWKSDVEIKWGKISNQNPIDNGGDPLIAGHLDAFDGKPAFDWANHQQTLQIRRGDEFTPIGVDHGTLDTVIEWTTQGQPCYGLLDAAATCWSGDVLSAGHTSSNISLLPGALGKIATVPYSAFKAVRNETLPGFSQGSGNLSIPPTQVGSYNRHIDWSASWQPWDGAPIDQPGVWQVSLRPKNLVVQFIDVTPRRCQQFEQLPNVAYRYTVERISDGSLLDSDLLWTDPDGLLTVPAVEVAGTGVRVRIERLLAGDLDNLSLSSGGVQRLALRTSAAFAGKLYWTLGSASGTAPGLLIDGILLQLVYDAWTDYTLTVPNGQILVNSLGALDARGEADIDLTLPPGLSPALAGVTLHHACVVIDIPGSESLSLATEPVAVTLVP
jgi:pimeloyl-ACP methyl ester carboxylesterase